MFVDCIFLIICLLYVCTIAASVVKNVVFLVLAGVLFLNEVRAESYYEGVSRGSGYGYGGGILFCFSSKVIRCLFIFMPCDATFQCVLVLFCIVRSLLIDGV